MKWKMTKKNSQFMFRHVSYWIQRAPKGSKFEVVLMALDVNPVFGKLSSANTASRKKAIEALSEVKLVNGHDAMNALTYALDISGSKLSKAWKKGPDTIVYVCCGVPWQAKETDQDQIAAAIGLKGEMRLVPIHTIGVGTHPYEMMRTISTRSGGRYVDLNK